MTRSAKQPQKTTTKPKPRGRKPAARPAEKRHFVPMSFSIEQEQLRALEAMAEREHTTRSALVKIAISRLLRDGI